LTGSRILHSAPRHGTFPYPRLLSQLDLIHDFFAIIAAVGEGISSFSVVIETRTSLFRLLDGRTNGQVCDEVETMARAAGRVRDEWLVLRCQLSEPQVFAELVRELERPLLYSATKLHQRPHLRLDLRPRFSPHWNGNCHLKD
jgi:hypothetical protein